MTQAMQITAFQNAIGPSHNRHGTRWKNQDALAIHTPTFCRIVQKQHFEYVDDAVCTPFVWVSVADGVSSSPHGDLASRSFLQVLHEHASGAVLATAAQLATRVRWARQEWQYRHRTEKTEGAATTLASLACVNSQVCAVNSGDSRIWRIRPDATGHPVWLPISRDHTIWQHMVDEGTVAQEEREQYASLYQGLLHCLILGDDAQELSDEDADMATSTQDWLHVWHGQAQAGDIYLLASDGLHDTLGDARLESLWHPQREPANNLRALRQAYLDAGAPDDVSLVMLYLNEAF